MKDFFVAIVAAAMVAALGVFCFYIFLDVLGYL